MQLGERKRRILQAIIRDYIETAEPVGSRTISKKHIHELSSATIRNEMADLEEMGFLEQPHTSAGRIPSDLGYRVFVDSMLEQYKLTMLEMSQMQDAINTKMKEVDKTLSELSAVLSHLTNYAAVAMKRMIVKGNIETIQAIYVDGFRMVVILVTSEGTVKNKLFIAREMIATENVTRLSFVLNSKAHEINVSWVTKERVDEITVLTGFGVDIIEDVMEFILDTLNESDSTKVTVDGSINLLNFPEYSDISKAKQILEFIHDGNIINTLTALPTGDSSIKVLIGHENPLEGFKDCSIILCNYNLGGNLGSIGLIGPTRMDYSKAISMLEYIKHELSEIIDFGS